MAKEETKAAKLAKEAVIAWADSLNPGVRAAMSGHDLIRLSEAFEVALTMEAMVEDGAGG